MKTGTQDKVIIEKAWVRLNNGMKSGESREVKDEKDKVL
jgi:hypothetical protein